MLENIDGEGGGVMDVNKKRSDDGSIKVRNIELEDVSKGGEVAEEG